MRNSKQLFYCIHYATEMKYNKRQGVQAQQMHVLHFAKSCDDDSAKKHRALHDFM